MEAIEFDQILGDPPGFRADAVMGNSIFETLIEPRDARRLRTTLIEMARIAAADPARRVVLLVDEPRITEARFLDEWQGAASVIRPEFFDRMSVAIRRSGEWTGLPRPPDVGQTAILDRIIGHSASKKTVGARKGSEAHYDILCILIHCWLRGKGSIPISSLMETSGTSHPTVSRSLDRLAHCLERHSDRSVKLRFFPREEWNRLLAVADDVRGTVRFADRSGQPRSPDSLLKRLRNLNRKDIAIGGVLGAKHYYPALDLIGAPRLDLSIHSGRRVPNLSFVDRLDPALERTTRPDEPPILVVHAVRRADPLFEPDDGGVPWADPVECLLDLHEARLEPQALEFLHSFRAAKGGSP